MGKQKSEKSYDDILYMPHYESSKHPPMSRKDRAAQFAPFSALTGHQSALDETARLTSSEVLLAEDAKAYLNEQFQYLKQSIGREQNTKIIYFVPDSSKSGGAYQEYSGVVRKIDEVYRTLIFKDQKEISLDCIVDIQM